MWVLQGKAKQQQPIQNFTLHKVVHNTCKQPAFSLIQITKTAK